MIILGSGLAGLIAADLMRDDVVEIWEAQKEVPNNHHAILRFRSSVVGDALNIPFKQVNVIKSINSHRNPAADMIAYGMKVLGRATTRSIVTADNELSKRYIAPPDLIPRLAKRAKGKLLLGKAFEGQHQIGTQPFVSTMPMTVLMKLLQYPHYERVRPLFKYRGGSVVRATIPNCDVYATVYEPDPNQYFYRVSITGDELFIESTSKDLEALRVSLSDDEYRLWVEKFVVRPALKAIGLRMWVNPNELSWEVKSQQYAKIDSVPEEVRQEFILWATSQGVLSLGRFATWRPNLLLDDLINDIQVIRKLATGSKNPQYKESVKL